MQTVSATKSQMEAACETHHATLLAHARQFLGARKGDALDYVQETIARFLAAFPDGPPPEPRCGGWLMTTLTHLLIGDWRKLGVRRRALADPALHVVSASPVTVVEVAPPAVDAKLDWLNSEEYEAAVSSMSHKLREVYKLHVLGLSHLQIAERLEITVVAARKRLHDARTHLKAHLPIWARGSEP